MFSHIVWDYKDEKWWLLLSSLLDRALSCAYVAANVEDYINFSLEALGPLAKFDSEKRKRIFNNLMAAVQVVALEEICLKTFEFLNYNFIF